MYLLIYSYVKIYIGGAPGSINQDYEGEKAFELLDPKLYGKISMPNRQINVRWISPQE